MRRGRTSTVSYPGPSPGNTRESLNLLLFLNSKLIEIIFNLQVFNRVDHMKPAVNHTYANLQTSIFKSALLWLHAEIFHGGNLFPLSLFINVVFLL